MLFRSDVSCNGDHWFLIYEGTTLIKYGTHTGQITSGNTNLTIEYMDSEQEMLDRLVVLGIELPEEEE